MKRKKKGLYTLENADMFNLLCIPPYNADNNVDKDVIMKAAVYCEKRHAMLIIDAPSSWTNKETAIDGMKKDDIGTFMNSVFKQGAFQGSKPNEAYFVKCDSETTTQDDINKGIVNILVGFAPLKPAEFVIIKISQMAGKLGGG